MSVPLARHPAPSGSPWPCWPCAQFVIVLDASIVNVALPSIGRDLDFSQDNLSWVVNAYTLTFGGFLLLGGRLADLLGRRRMFIVGLILFALASLAGGLAAERQLITARAVQGLGAAIISPAALSIVTTTFTRGHRAQHGARRVGRRGRLRRRGRRAAGRHADRVGGLGVGAVRQRPDRAGRRHAGAAAAGREPRRASAPASTSPGAVSVTAGLAILVYALVDANHAGWGSTRTLSLIARRARAAGHVRRDRVAHRRTRWCRSRSSACARCAGANVVGLLVGMSLFSMFFFISLYLQQVLGYSALKAGLAYLPLALLIIVSAGVASQLVTRSASSRR